ncbi:sensor histidine kinase [Demequina lutea]|uniref:Sensor-like histidine kinase SenX3 n=2 Tax=Demequina lutea TaxID=431489 RepID=A0A7Y9Z983_9MICO|nr:ATP-binding protein [Demequina lutea]NYI40338.1 signal transduction histidine kinase [Demequina lutea]
MALADRADLATRLLIAIALVVGVGAATDWAVGATVGPGLFHEHLLRAVATGESPTDHADRAYAAASALTLSIALVTALIASAGVSVIIARRIRRSLAPFAQAAHRVAIGERNVTVSPPGIGPEFDRVAAAFTAMATDLAHVEDTRTHMLADLAHEMRTPLAVLAAYLEAVGDGVERLDESTMHIMQAQVERLSRLSADVALVTSAQEGRLSLDRHPIDVDTVVKGAAAQESDRLAECGLTIHVRSAPGLLVDADPDRIGQVLTNLLENARQHTPPGGVVDVEATAEVDAVRVTVHDSGEGIAPQDLPRVFDRFFRVDVARDRAHGGSGIGLSIARAIATAHGGTLVAESEGLSMGSTFSLTLLRLRTEPERAGAPER